MPFSRAASVFLICSIRALPTLSTCQIEAARAAAQPSADEPSGESSDSEPTPSDESEGTTT